MKKLALNLDALQVQSFATVEYVRVPGTVHAAQNTGPTGCTCGIWPYPTECENTCRTCNDPSCYSCDDTCWNTCQHTCATGVCACDQEP